MNQQTAAPLMTCVLTCPECGIQHTETMPCDACIYFYECSACGKVLRPKPGDCCVFCSCGSVPCPPIQTQRAGRISSEACCKR